MIAQRSFAAVTLCLVGCTVGPMPGIDAGDLPGTDADLPGTDAGGGGTDAAGGGTDAGGGTVTCAPPGVSVCGNPASIVRGVVRLAPGLAPTSATGTLFVGLSHLRLGGGSTGGFPHVTTILPGVNLASGSVEFALDMCSAGEMWSEENCEFNLVAVLDTNGNNNDSNFLPDPGEASFRTVIELSCAAVSPCLDVALDCTAGASCVSFADGAACSCSASSCMSDIVTCS